MSYRGIVIKESLKDPEILEGLEILSRKIETNDTTSQVLNMYKVRVNDDELHLLVEKLEKDLKQDEPWYLHFYDENPNKDQLITVFSNTHFIDSKRDFSRSIEYGRSLGIPAKQLDFSPHNIADETW